MRYKDFKLVMQMSDEYSHHCVNIMISKGADVNMADPLGETLLIRSVKHNKELCVKRLLQSGVDVHKVDICGKDALMYAAHSGYFNCMKEIIQAGAHVNAVSDAGLNALGYFRIYHCWELGSGTDGRLVHTVKSWRYVGDELPFSPDQEAALNLLLQKGSKINVGRTFRRGNRQLFLPMKFYAVLRAAGEDMGGFSLTHDQEEDNNISDPKELKELCRANIRQCLLNVDRHTDLFQRIPKIGLPTMLTKYLLYNEKLFSGIFATTDCDKRRKYEHI